MSKEEEGTAEKKGERRDEFETWWSGYPHKVGKGAARKAFATASKIASFHDLQVGVMRYRRDKPPHQAWCHPSTWLNQERWLDEPAPAPTASINGSYSHDLQNPRSVHAAIARLDDLASGRTPNPFDIGPGDTAGADAVGLLPKN